MDSRAGTLAWRSGACGDTAACRRCGCADVGTRSPTRSLARRDHALISATAAVRNGRDSLRRLRRRIVDRPDRDDERHVDLLGRTVLARRRGSSGRSGPATRTRDAARRTNAHPRDGSGRVETALPAATGEVVRVTRPRILKYGRHPIARQSAVRDSAAGPRRSPSAQALRCITDSLPPRGPTLAPP